MTFKTILVAIGYDEEAKNVARQAKYLAERHNAKLVFIHVVEPLQFMGEPTAFGFIQLFQDEEEAREQARKQLDRIVDAVGIDPYAAQRIVASGAIEEEIVKQAQKSGGDLVVVGSHEKPIWGLYLGSTANAVLHRATTDVLVIRAGREAGREEPHGYKRILLAIDFTPEIEPVISRAKALATLYGAELRMVHVVNRAPVFEMPLSLFEKEIMEKVDWQFQQLSASHGLGEVASELLLGSPGLEITRYAERENIDLIVLGSHAKHGVGLLFGSTANAVLHRAQCDVLAVRV